MLSWRVGGAKLCRFFYVAALLQCRGYKDSLRELQVQQCSQESSGAPILVGFLVCYTPLVRFFC